MTGPATRRRLALAAAWLGLSVGALLIAAAVTTARLFLWPVTADVARADAVIVLSGDFGDRIAMGLTLMRAGVAPTLVIDGQPDFPAVAALCAGPQPFEVVCLLPHPDSTRAEARAAGTLAAVRKWRTVAVVTTRSHVTRAGLLFRRCVTGSVRMVGTNPPYGSRRTLHAIGHEWLGLVDALVRERSC